MIINKLKRNMEGSVFGLPCMRDLRGVATAGDKGCESRNGQLCECLCPLEPNLSPSALSAAGFNRIAATQYFIHN